METSADGINGNITWSSDLVVYNAGTKDGRYEMDNLIDGKYGNNYTPENIHQSYWMTNGKNVRPEYLKIQFPETVYLTKIRTYNYSWQYDDRYLQSYLWVSSDNVNFTNKGLFL